MADPEKPIVTNRTRPSISGRPVYFEGLMALHTIDPAPGYYRYAVSWADSHGCNPPNGPMTRSADDQCCGQTYLELHRLDPQPAGPPLRP